MSDQSKPVWKLLGVSLGLAALVWVVFGQTLTHGFVNFDDGTYVYRNPDVTQGITADGIKWAFSHVVAANWHPLTMLSHMLDCQMYGVTPAGHHFTNVLLHTVATILLFLVLWSSTAALWRSAFVAAVFAIHPLHVESVAWIAERKDVLSAVFFMLTLGAYVHFVRRPGIIRYLILSGCFALGLMAKPMLVTIPFVLLLLDYWPLNRFGRTTAARLFLEKLPLLLLTTAACVETILSQHQSINLIKTVSLETRIANAFIALMIYIRQTFWPANLAVFYPHPENNIPFWQISVAVAFVALISIAAVAARKKVPYFLTGWCWYVGMLVPVVGVVQVGIQAHADRYMYLPQIGLSLIITWSLAALSTRWQHRQAISAVLSLLVLLPLVWCARIQASHWNDSVSLWTHALAVAPDNELLREHLSDAYLDRGQIKDALEQARQAVTIQSDSASARATLGAALARDGKLDEAIETLRTALDSNPKIARAHYNLGNVLLQENRVDEAIENYEKELQLQSNFAEGHNNLASALFRKGKLDEAQIHLRTAVALNPNNPETHNNLGIALSQKGEMREAIAEWNKTLAIQRDNLEAQCNLSWIYATFPDDSIRNGPRALELAQKALLLSDSKSAKIWRLAAAAYAETGQFAPAIKSAENALALAQAEGNSALVQTLQANIKQFRESKPLRDVGASR